MRILFWALVATTILIVVGMCVGVSSGSNVSVNEVGATYIIWNTENNISHFWLDGQDVIVYGSLYGQYGLSPGSVHIGCEENTTCTGVTTLDNGYSIFRYWLVFLVLVALCFITYHVPITYAPTLIYGLYLLTIYLPEIGAPFEQMILVVVLIVVGLIAAIGGYRK